MLRDESLRYSDSTIGKADGGQVFIKGLDSLDMELNEILGQLKSVALDPGFDAVNAVEVRQNPPRKSLHDFVDELGIEELKAQLRQAIDEVQVPSPSHFPKAYTC